jgi:hypothetical protein
MLIVNVLLSIARLINFEEFRILNITLSAIILFSYIPIITFSVAFVYKSERNIFWLELKNNILKFLLPLIFFIILAICLNNFFVLNESDGYQEETLSFVLNGGLFFMHTLVFTVFFVIFLNKGKNSSFERNRQFFFNIIFVFSIIIFTLNLLSINSCSDDPVLFLLSFCSVLFCIIISIIDLITSIIKKHFSYILLIYTSFLLIYALALIFLNKIFGNDGKCNFIFGPDDSAMTLTFLILTLYSYIAKRRSI